MLRNMAGSLLHALSGGRFASPPVQHEMARWYRALARYSQSFALVGDWTVACRGGDLKRKQRISGRMADILSDLYLISAVLKRYEDEGRIREDGPLVDAIVKNHLFAIEQSFASVFANCPGRGRAGRGGGRGGPRGRRRRPAAGRET